MPRRKQKEIIKFDENTILGQLLNELSQKINDNKITKGQALIKKIVDEALGGDQRMLANILKLIEKLDALQSAKTAEEKQESNENNEEIILRYYGKNRERIEKELEKRYKEKPEAWYFYEKYMTK